MDFISPAVVPLLRSVFNSLYLFLLTPQSSPLPLLSSPLSSLIKVLVERSNSLVLIEEEEEDEEIVRSEFSGLSDMPTRKLLGEFRLQHSYESSLKLGTLKIVLENEFTLCLSLSILCPFTLYIYFFYNPSLPIPSSLSLTPIVECGDPSVFWENADMREVASIDPQSIEPRYFPLMIDVHCSKLENTQSEEQIGYFTLSLSHTQTYALSRPIQTIIHTNSMYMQILLQPLQRWTQLTMTKR